MLSGDFGFGQYWITDRPFGPVIGGDPTFRERFEAHTGIIPERIIWMNQVHGDRIEYVGSDRKDKEVLSETDGLWTRQPGTLLVTTTADCVPLLAWNEEVNMVAALHVGWKGFLNGILGSFCEVLDGEGWYGAEGLEHFKIFLGPHLRWKSFEVKRDFIAEAKKFKKYFYISPFIYEEEGKFCFNLTQALTVKLWECLTHKIEDCGINTFTHPGYYSYRGWSKLPEDSRPETYSTFASAIMLK